MPPDGKVSAQDARLASLVRARSGASFSLKEVAQHNTPADCWLIVRGKVYDVTEWCARGTSARALRCEAPCDAQR